MDGIAHFTPDDFGPVRGLDTNYLGTVSGKTFTKPVQDTQGVIAPPIDPPASVPDTPSSAPGTGGGPSLPLPLPAITAGDIGGVAMQTNMIGTASITPIGADPGPEAQAGQVASSGGLNNNLLMVMGLGLLAVVLA